MKNTNEYKVSRPASLTPDMGYALQRREAELRNAKRDYENAKTKFFDILCDELRANPGMTVICKDVAKIGGMLPTQVGTELSKRFDDGIRHQDVEVCRTFAEVDEDGNLIEGGEVKDITRIYSGYRAKTKDDRW